jgi:DNA-binding LacI/PurR family transcriptional regulator
VRQDARQAAEALIDTLLEAIETGSASDKVLPVKLTVRESSAKKSHPRSAQAHPAR